MHRNFRKTSGLQLYLKRDSGTVFSCEFCAILKNTFSYRIPLLVAASEKPYEFMKINKKLNSFFSDLGQTKNVRELGQTQAWKFTCLFYLSNSTKERESNI